VALKGKVDDARYAQVLELFTYQAGHAIVWRDAVNDWFRKISGIDDAKGRVGHHPGRIEAEAIEAVGYKSVDVTPWETASGGKAVVCGSAACTLTAKLDEAAGTYDIAVQYFDLRTGVSSYELAVNGKVVASWKADDVLPPVVVDPKLDGHTSTRYTVRGVMLKPGDSLVLKGVPEGKEPAPVDYLEITPAVGSGAN
jgi:alpha-glucuronidase